MSAQLKLCASVYYLAAWSIFTAIGEQGMRFHNVCPPPAGSLAPTLLISSLLITSLAEQDVWASGCLGTAFRNLRTVLLLAFK